MRLQGKFKMGDCVKEKSGDQKMIIAKIVGDHASCVWTYKKKNTKIVLFSDLIHCKSDAGIITLKHKY